VVTPFPGAIETKPGSATVPFFGIEPAILDPTTGRVRVPRAVGMCHVVIPDLVLLGTARQRRRGRAGAQAALAFDRADRVQ
jgi:acyl-coenzyme A synthetase/AMP-(fatty) acid ligase